jgi:hypothetical protein
MVDSASGAERKSERFDEVAGQASRIAIRSTAQQIILEPARKIAVAHNLSNLLAAGTIHELLRRFGIMPALSSAAIPLIGMAWGGKPKMNRNWHRYGFQAAPR